MYCEECKRKPATVHVTKIIDGKKHESHLCATCAQKDQMDVGVQPSFAIPNFLAALFNLNPEIAAPFVPDNADDTCKKCGVSFNKITQTGRLGCNQCYQEFSDRLEPLLRRIHGSGQHLGKVPQRRGGLIRQKHEISQLRVNLQQFVAREEFEQAAVIRDEIRKLEQGLEG